MQADYAYGRVSSDGQNAARQLNEFLKLGIPKSNIIIEKVSGKDFNRKKYNNLLKRLKCSDCLYIDSIDRLGRDYDGIISEWNKLTKEMKVIVKVLDMPLLNSDKKITTLVDKFVRDTVLLTLAYQAEQEWQNIKTRQKAGIAIAKESGKHLGRPKTVHSKKEIRVVSDWQNGLLSLDAAMQKLGRKKTSFYRLVRALK